MGSLFRNRNLCSFWLVAKPFVRMDTVRKASIHSSLTDNLCKLKFFPYLTYNRLRSSNNMFMINFARCQDTQRALFTNDVTSRRSRKTQLRTVISCHFQITSCVAAVQVRKFSKSCENHCKSRKDETSDNVDQKITAGSKQADKELAPEWIHPSTREDSVIKTDTELKSILHDLASDFGEDSSSSTKSKSGDADDEKMQDTHDIDELESTSNHTGEGECGNRTDADENLKEKGTRNVSEGSIRKANGVLSLADIVEILRNDNAQDLCVIRVPKEVQYVDYFIVVSGRSTRHLKAMASYLNKVYKMLRKGGEPFVKIEGKNSDDWMCIDFGDIVVHFMLEETRELYELEMLWTLGPEYDDQYHRISQYQANVLTPTMPTQEELEELQKLQQEDASRLEEQEGYNVVIMGEGEREVELSDDKKI